MFERTKTFLLAAKVIIGIIIMPIIIWYNKMKHKIFGEEDEDTEAD